MTLRHELLLLRRDRAAWTALLLLAMACTVAVSNGVRWRETQRTAQARALSNEATEYASRQAAVAEYEAHPPPPLDAVLNNLHDPTSPYVVGQAGRIVHLPLPAASSLAIGQMDLLPLQELVSIRTRQRTVADKDGLENPLQLEAGRFDLAFVIVYLLPLLILSLTYNLVSLEREEGTLGLLRCQASSLARVMLGRTLLRTCLLVVVCVAAAAAGVGFASPPSLAAVIGLIVFYAYFWAALSMYVNSREASSTSHAATLVVIWLLVVAIVPATLHLAVQSLRPVASRLELLDAVRNHSIDARRDAKKLVADWYAAHPNMVPAAYAGALYDTATGGTLTHVEQDRRTLPLDASFDEAVAARQDLVNRVKYLSPAIIASEGLFDAAGTSLERYRDYKLQVRAFREKWLGAFHPRIFRKQVLHPSDYATFPEFHYQETATLHSVPGITALLLASSVLALAAMRRLR